MRWQFSQFPELTHSVFLSHSAEDRTWLVQPVMAELKRRGIKAWFDQDDYPYAHDPFAALRESLLRCRAVVYFITDAALRNWRGWQSAERAYGAIISDQLSVDGSALVHFELPLFFFRAQPARSLLDRIKTILRLNYRGFDGRQRVNQSIWQRLQQMGPDCNHDGLDAVDWAVDQIATHLQREREHAKSVLDEASQDPVFLEQIRAVRGRWERVGIVDPPDA